MSLSEVIEKLLKIVPTCHTAKFQISEKLFATIPTYILVMFSHYFPIFRVLRTMPLKASKMKRNAAGREQFTPPQLASHITSIKSLALHKQASTPRTPNTDSICAVRGVPHYRLKNYTFSPRKFFHQFLCWHLHSK